jgi:mRNA interferase YafQ
MLEVKRTNKFKKEYKLMRKRGKNMGKINLAILLIARGVPLPAEYMEHPLRGRYEGCSECHIEPDWLLVYRIEDDIVHFARTGTHADLFK